MLKDPPKDPFIKALYDEGKMLRHLQAHAFTTRIVVRHDCKLCPAPMDITRHPDAIFANVYPEGRRVDKEDLEGRANGWDPQSGCYFRE